MRHFQIMIPESWFLTEAKARIDHPEDLVFDEGSAGAKRAIAGLMSAVSEPHRFKVKWDGSPALIFGRDADGFTLTDKAGLSSKKPGGLPRSASELKTMLFMRKPDDPGREAYANQIAGLWPLLQGIVPSGFAGYLQGDLLWSKRPPVVDGHYVFKPNKITYTIPVDSALGALISRSQAGIAIHSIYHDKDQLEPDPIGDIDELGLKPSTALVVLADDVGTPVMRPLPKGMQDKLETLVSRTAKDVDTLLDKSSLSQLGITDLPALMKRYVNQRAYAGQRGLDDAADGFIEWVSSPSSGLTDRKRKNVLDWIAKNPRGYRSTWSIASAITSLKDKIKPQIDTHVSGTVGTEYKGLPGHEGYVYDTKHGKFKMVDRPHFMQKEQA